MWRLIKLFKEWESDFFIIGSADKAIVGEVDGSGAIVRQTKLSWGLFFAIFLTTLFLSMDF